MSKFDGRTVLVSGGARGIGAAIARAVVEEGGCVVIGDVLDAEAAKVVADLGEDRAIGVHLDVTDGSQWRDAVTAAESRFSALNVLVNNAGILRWGPIAELDPGTWQEVLDVNLTGVFLGMQAAVPALRRAGGGSIVNVSSTAGLEGYAGLPAYVASKWGVRGLTKAAALELAPDHIRVNSVHPGPIRTPMIETDDLAQSAVRDQILATQPIPRMGEPEEVARLVLFLAGDDASFSTGSEFVVDGGLVTGQVVHGPAAT